MAKQLPGPKVPVAPKAAKVKKPMSRRSLGRHAAVGLFASVFMFGGLGVWAATTELSGAIVSQGLTVIAGGSKRVQHQEGGIVEAIFVANEDHVDAGDLLLRLDGTTIRANLAVVMSQLNEAVARQARLTAESIGADHIAMPPELAGFVDQDALTVLFAAQEQLRASRASSIAGQAARLEEQTAQIELQIAGLESQQVAIKEQLDIVNGEATDLAGLLEQGLVQASRVNEIKREQARLLGEEGRIESDIAGARAAIAERRVVAEQTKADFQSQVLSDLQDVSVQVAQLLQQKIAAEDRLARLEIRAPQTGIIHESVVQTVGGVVGAGETLMLVVPPTEELLVDTRISPLDIDKVYPGQGVMLRLTSLNTRTTPELVATVRSLSPDLTRDPQTGFQYFVVRVEVADAEFERLPTGTKIGPGMPVDVYAQTGDRTVLTYLFQPLMEQLNHTFRED